MKLGYIKNAGSPTRWDLTAYLDYIDKNSEKFSAEILDLFSEDRLNPSSPSSLHEALLTTCTFFVSGESNKRRVDADIILLSDAEDRYFNFRYEGVVEADIMGRQFRYLPVLVMHEVVALKNGCYRHVLCELGGEQHAIVCRGIRFSEVLLKSAKPI